MQVRRFINSQYSMTIACEGTVALSQLLMYKMAFHFWGANGFAEYAVVRRAISLILPALALGLTVALPRQVASISAAGQPRSRSAYLTAALLIACASIAGATSILTVNSHVTALVLFGDAKYGSLVEAVVAMLAAITLYTIVYAYYRATHLVIANLLQVLVLAILPPAVLLATSTGLSAYFVRLAIASVVIGGVAAVFTKLHFGDVCSHATSLLRFGIVRAPGELVLAGVFATPVLVVTHYSGLLRGGFVAFGISLLLMIGAAIVPVGVVLLPRASRMLAQGQIAELTRHVAQVAGLCLALTSTIFLALEAALGPLVRALLGAQGAEAVAACRILTVAAVPYGMYICLRSVLDACHETAFNTRHVVASAATFAVLAITSIRFESNAYLGILWSFVAANWVLGGLTILRLHSIFAGLRLLGTPPLSEARQPG